MTKIVKSKKQLDSLPAGTILRDREGDAWQKDEGGEFYLAGGEFLHEADGIAKFAPFQVLWEGGVDDKAE